MRLKVVLHYIGLLIASLGCCMLLPLGWSIFYKEPDWLDPVGSHQFVTYVEDRNEPGRGVDQVWFEVMDKDNNVIAVMSMTDPANENTEPIMGGNLVVPHGKKKKK